VYALVLMTKGVLIKGKQENGAVGFRDNKKD
jgi:hypothetical protein